MVVHHRHQNYIQSIFICLGNELEEAAQSLELMSSCLLAELMTTIEPADIQREL